MYSGITISHYTILDKLGEGGMGVVCKARDTKLEDFTGHQPTLYRKFCLDYVSVFTVKLYQDRERFGR